MCWLVRTSKDLGARPPLASRCISLSWLFFHGGNTVRTPSTSVVLSSIWPTQELHPRSISLLRPLRYLRSPPKPFESLKPHLNLALKGCALPFVRLFHEMTGANNKERRNLRHHGS